MEAPTPLISVVVPAFRHEAYVVEALESVYGQDYPRVELVIIDDRSPDTTPEQIASFLAREHVVSRFERIVFLQNERNLGAHGTINRGIAESRGTYVNILNSDDLFGPRRLSTLLGHCRKTMARLAFSYVSLTGTGNPGCRADIEFLASLQASIDSFPTVGYALLHNQVAISSGNFFFERELFNRVGPFSALKYCHDWDFILRAVLVTEPVVVPEPHYVYRVHDGNSFQQLRGVADAETEAVLKRYLFLCRNRPVQNPLAPSPAWGPYFESFLTTSRYERFLVKP